MARPRKNEETTTPWVVRDVPADTRRKVRVYAAEHDLTMAQAVEQLVENASSTASTAQPTVSLPARAPEGGTPQPFNRPRWRLEEDVEHLEHVLTAMEKGDNMFARILLRDYIDGVIDEIRVQKVAAAMAADDAKVEKQADKALRSDEPILSIPEHTYQTIEKYMARTGLSWGQAIESLVEVGMNKLGMAGPTDTVERRN